MKFVATQDLGALGPDRTKPRLRGWSWWYNVPYLALWAAVVLALVLPENNRNRQAWLILIPMFLVLLLWRMPVRLVSLPGSSAAFFGLMATSLAIGWTLVWLLSNRLVRGHAQNDFFRAAAVMLVIGVWAYLADYGFAVNAGMVQSTVAFGVSAVALLAAMGLARRFSGEAYRPGPLMGWLFLSMLLTAAVAALASMSLTFLPSLAILGPLVLLMLLVSTAFMSIFLAISLYLFNLPFMLLAFKSPFYRDRFEAALRLQRVEDEVQADDAFAAAAANETLEPEGLGQETAGVETRPTDE